MSTNEKLKKFIMVKNPNFSIIQQFQELEIKTKEMIEKEIEKAVIKLEEILSNDSIFNGLAPIKKIAEKTAKEEIRSFKEEIDDTVKMALSEFKEKKEEILAILKNNIEQIKADFSYQAKKELEEIENEFKGKIETAIAEIETVPGEDGEDGEDGNKGNDGYSPKKGVDYFDGKDGSPDTPEQIVEKLNKTEQSIELKAIKGLENELKTLRQNVAGSKSGKGKGGGMGNVQHETFNISAGTTTVTTTYPIAGQGQAVFNFTYENARLEMTNHYTVGSDGKTITFNADIQAQFVNNTVAAITYIRG